MAANGERASRKSGDGAQSGGSDISLSSAVDVLHEALDESLCEEIFNDLREKERNRKWSLFTLARFWTAVVLDAPPALTQALERSRGVYRSGCALFPNVDASNAAFFEKCKNFNGVFFEALYSSFIAKIRDKAPATYAAEFEHLQERFSNVLLIDGSRLDRIAKRLKILRNEKAVILPGCLTAIYDVFRGLAVQLSFSADAAESEFQRALPALEPVESGSLLVGDRLYCSRKLFQFLNARNLFGVFRRTKAMKFEEVECLSRKKSGENTVEDWLVRSGKGKNAIELRLIRLVRDGRTYETLTNDLDPEHLTVDEILNLYPLRWQVERLFYDLKVVLNLKKLYAANPNAIAMQVFATAMVHGAFRVAQARIAKEHDLPPEELSPKKLFPILSAAAITLLSRDFFFEEVCELNPGKNLVKPTTTNHPNLHTTLRAIRRVKRRSNERKPPTYSRERATWKSLAHVDPKAFDLS